MSEQWPNRVTVGSFVADNGASDDFRVTARVTGWGAPQIRLEMDDRSQQDGGWDSTPYYSPRVVTIDGVVVQPSHAAAQAVADELRALDLRALHVLTVDNDALGERSSLARLQIKADPEWVTDRFFRYSLQLVAPDPLLYGADVTGETSLASVDGGAGLTFPLSFPLDFGVAPGVIPGAVVVGNAGTAPYYLRLRIDGPVTNPVVSLTETGDQVRYVGTVADGQWLEVDCAKRSVLLNGSVDVRANARFTGDWLRVPVGGGSVSWTADTSDPDSSLFVWSKEGAWL